MAKIVFLIHGKSAHRHKTMEEAKAVFSQGYEVVCQVTRLPGQFAALTYSAIREGAMHIICAGGDGSLNETINGLMLARQDAALQHINWQDIRVGLLPSGTGNDFARTLGVAHDMAALKGYIEKDSFRKIDLGFVELTSPQGGKTSRYFVNILDVGIGGTISQKLATSSKRLGATITYQTAILRALFTYTNQRIEIAADTFNHQGRVMNFIMANGKYFGGGLGIAPDARPDDGQFSTVIIGDISIVDYLMNLGKVKKCIKPDNPELKYFNAAAVAVSSPDGPLPVDMDGEFAGYSPLRLSMVPGAFNFLCPA